MSKKKIQISIPQPCNEGWENMLPEEKGRFCLTCQKSLIDFSILTDSQVISILEKSNGKVCGRFSKDQLNKVLEEENLYSQNRLLKIAGFLFPFLIFNSTYAKSINSTFGITQIEKKIQNEESKTEKMDHTPTDSMKFISLIVQDFDTGEFLSFVNIYIDSSKTPIAITDIDGRAKFQVSSSANFIRIQSIGYFTLVENILPIDFNYELNIRLNSEDQLIEGDIIIIRNKPKWWQFRKKRAYKMQLLDND